MRFSEWEPRYREIMARFGFSRAREEASANWLARALSPRGSYPGRRARVGDLKTLLKDRDIFVIGRGPGTFPPALPGSRTGRGVVVACDGATSSCLARGWVPDLVVTDLDGRLSDEVRANGLGSLVLVHAHGDNLPVLRRWLDRFPGPLLGSCSARPRGPLVNFGGFTDGDRAVLLAESLGARTVRLVRFDFDHPAEGPGPAGRVKREKLAVAREILGEVQGRGRLSVLPFRDALRSRSPRPPGARPGHALAHLRSPERPRRASPLVRPRTRGRSRGP